LLSVNGIDTLLLFFVCYFCFIWGFAYWAGSGYASDRDAVISAAMARAAPNYMPLTQQANQQVFVLGPNALADGPYRVPGPTKK
jgi:hypothetical protein